MHAVPRPILVLHASQRLWSQLRGIPAGPYRLERVKSWEALTRAYRRSPPTALVLVDPYAGHAGARALSEHLHDWLRAFPDSTVVAAFDAARAGVDDLRALVGWGVAEVVDLLREDTAAALSVRLAGVHGHTVHRLLRRAFPAGLPSRTRVLLSVAAETVAAGGQAPELAAVLGVDERTVPRWCARADLPPPRRLLAWLRLLMAADLLDDPHRSQADVARAIGYSSAASLAGAVRAMLGVGPRDLRDRGAFPAVAEAFSRELFELREQAREEGRRPTSWLH
jgi:AraC-like DNA-binding protein